LLFPIDWPEPFGLAMIEAMACGTPTLAFRCGSVPEILSPLTGQIVETMDEAVSAVESLLATDRRAIRRAFEARFTASRMARDYVSLYESIAAVRETSVPRSPAALSMPQPQLEEHLTL
jgi:glycosyltransferase involved in cell wall biosynthesis